VYTAAELQAAINKGALDIEIRAHLDLRGLQIQKNPVVNRPNEPGYTSHTHLAYVSATRSIRVRRVSSSRSAAACSQHTTAAVGDAQPPAS
jgi:hypothetical protein